MTELMLYVALGMKAAELLTKAANEGRAPTDDDLAALKASDEFRALAEAMWAETLPKQPKVKREPPNRAR